MAVFTVSGTLPADARRAVATPSPARQSINGVPYVVDLRSIVANSDGSFSIDLPYFSGIIWTIFPVNSAGFTPKTIVPASANLTYSFNSNSAGTSSVAAPLGSDLYRDLGPVSGSVPVTGGGFVYALDLSADATVTITGGVDGDVMGLNVVYPNSHTLTIGSTVIPAAADEYVVSLIRRRGNWKVVSSGGGSSTPLIDVTPGAVTFSDPSGTGSDTYTIPSTANVVYKIGATVQTPGAHAGSGSVTVVATPASGYQIASGATATWSHTFDTTVASTVILHDTFTAADGTILDGRTPDFGPAWVKGIWYAGHNPSMHDFAISGGKIDVPSTSGVYNDSHFVDLGGTHVNGIKVTFDFELANGNQLDIDAVSAAVRLQGTAPGIIIGPSPAGGFTTPPSGTAAVHSGTCEMTFTTSLVTIKVGGATVATGVPSGAQDGTYITIGLTMQASGDTTLDNFVVVAL